MDLIYVTYNSEKWIDGCFNALAKSDYNLKELNIFVVDNYSTDNTLQKLNSISKDYSEIFGCIDIIKSETNIGFGQANNLAFRSGNSEIVVFLNIDTEVYENTLTILELEICSSNEKTAMWEMRQFPYEHPKVYNPVTMETSWCSGAAFAVKRDVFASVGGFDAHIFMYVEDVDLSWRVRCNGYDIKYCPKSVISHFVYKNDGETKPTQYVYSVINNLLMRRRYGKFRNILGWYRTFFHILRVSEEFNGAKKILLREWITVLKIQKYFNTNKFKEKNLTPLFLGFDYEKTRTGAFYKNYFPAATPLVSILVRTCGRPNVLRETLQSLRNQTYQNIEIIVVEDGEAISQSMIENEFGDINVRYYSTGMRVGRSKVGNIAMQKATGMYFNFLDDDDLFYADHVEVLVANVLDTQYKASYSIGCETKIEVHSYEPYRYTLYEYNEVYKQNFDKLMLCHHNYIPIQCIMFHKSLFTLYGGFDESLDALEDWDLWVRFSLHTNFKFVEKVTSLYRVPYNNVQNEERQKKLDAALVILREKHKAYVHSISVNELALLYDKINK